jgi:hypothetical protein
MGAGIISKWMADLKGSLWFLRKTL